MMRNKTLWIILCIQIACCVIGFWHHFSQPTNALFHDQFDGFKNYTTLYTYVSSGKYSDAPFLTYDQMNYPYGDFITYTDNTPILASALKSLVSMGIEPGPWILVAFNWSLIFGIIISTVLLYFILGYFIQNKVVMATAALTLPWINPQLIRLSNGHFNLSLSWLLLLGIFLLIVFIKRRSQKEKIWPIGLYLVGSMLLAAGIHVYYLPIMGLMVGAFLFIYGLFRKFDFVSLACSVAIPGLALILFFIITNILDPNLGLRTDMQLGFNLDNWKLSFASLFTAYPHFGVEFFIHSKDWHNPESNSYLGAFVLFGGLTIWLYHRFANRPLPERNIFVNVFLVTGAICVITSMGTTISIPAFGLEIENMISPFYWAKKWTSAVDHFRCLARFNWPFFWAVNFFVLYFVDQVISKNEFNWPKYVGFVLLALLVLDAKDAIRFNHNEVYQNVIDYSDTEVTNELTKDLDFNSFEAIVPIPFYHVGCQNWDYTIHSDGMFSRKVAQLSSKGEIPQMSSLMSRTPLTFAVKQFNIFLDPTQSALLDLKTDKPLLLFINRALLERDLQQARADGREANARFLQKQIEFLDQTPLELISEYGDHKLMMWDKSTSGL